MMTQHADALVEDYLGRLEAASWPLAPDRRAELVEGIREHIIDARSAGSDAEGEVQEILARLGAPEEIARSAAAEGGAAIAPYPLLVQKPNLVHETWTVVLLTFGNLLLPVISWIAGAVLLVAGRRWLWWEKLLGVLVVPGGPAGALFAYSFLSTSGDVQQCTISGGHETCVGTAHLVRYGFATGALSLGLLAPLAVAYFLFRRAKRRAALEAPQLAAL